MIERGNKIATIYFEIPQSRILSRDYDCRRISLDVMYTRIYSRDRHWISLDIIKYLIPGYPEKIRVVSGIESISGYPGKIKIQR